MKKLCATTYQIEQWLLSCNSDENPEDLNVLEDPNLFLSCRLPDHLAGTAYACHGGECEEINEAEEVYAIAEEVWAQNLRSKIETRVANLIGLSRTETSHKKVFKQTIEMLKRLDREKSYPDLAACLDEIDNLPGADHPEIQEALTFARTLRADMLKSTEWHT